MPITGVCLSPQWFQRDRFCYLPVYALVTYASARTACQEHSIPWKTADLASIHDEHEALFVARLARHQVFYDVVVAGVWIGLRKPAGTSGKYLICSELSTLLTLNLNIFKCSFSIFTMFSTSELCFT